MPDDLIIRQRVLLLGDTLCGKTCLPSLWSQNNVPEGDICETRSFVNSTTTIDGRTVELALCDTIRMENHERMRRQSYYGLDIVLTPCFDNEDADSFENVNYMVSH